MKMPLPSLAPFIFDCDGVLVESERLGHRIESKLFQTMGLDLTFEEVHRTFMGKTVKDTITMISERSQHNLSPEWIYQWAMSIANGFVRELKPIPGIHMLLEELTRRGHLIGVASQSQLPRIQLALYITALEHYFGKHVYSASMVAKPKPAPDVFLHAAASMGVDPAHCIVIEDSPAGAQAACAAGMHVYGYAADQDAEKLAAAGAHVFYSMNELLDLLRDFPKNKVSEFQLSHLYDPKII